MKVLAFIISILLLSFSTSAQVYIGSVVDKETSEALIGANIQFVSESDTIYSTTDEMGAYSFSTPKKTGLLTITYLGYSPLKVSWNTSMNDLQIFMIIDESNISINPIIIANPFTSNDVSFSRKEFQTLAGAYEDPARLLLKAPGFSTSNDQANFILYKGLPSNFVNWTINGAPIVNPNHTSNAGSLSDVSSINAGGVNMVSSQVIGTYNFQSAPYSLLNNNTIAGSSDMGLSKYNKTYLNLSLVGLEAGYGYNGSNLPGLQVNYRYSFVGILTNGLGLDFGGEKISYQDFFAKIDLIAREDESLSAFAVYGNSANIHEADENRDKTASFKDISDIRFDSDILLSGVNYEKRFNGFKLKTSINYSQKKDQRYSLTRSPDFSSKDNLSQKLLGSSINLSKSWKNNSLLFGINTNYNQDERVRQVFSFEPKQVTFENLNLFPFLSYQKENQYFYFEVGGGMTYNSLSGNVVFEPNAKILGKINKSLNSELSYRRNSQLLSTTQFSYSLIPQEIKGDHLELSLNLTKQKFNAFVSTFYHYMSNILVEENSNYSQFTGLDHLLLQKHNYDGIGRSFGISYGANLNELVLKNLNFTANASHFQAEFSNAAGTWIDNTYDFNSSLNFIATYSIPLAKDKEILFSGAYHTRGGLKEFPIDNVQSFFNGQAVFDYSSLPQESLSAYQRYDFRFLYNLRKGNYRKFAQSISLDIQNITNKENDGFTNIDFRSGDLFIQKQLGMVPVLAYRIEF